MKYLSLLTKQANLFTTESFYEFLKRHNLNWFPIPDVKPYSYYDEDIEDSLEQIYNLIPKTFKNQFPKVKEIKAIYQSWMKQVLEDGEADAAEMKQIEDFLKQKIQEMFKAVEKDREDWKKTPTLPGLDSRGRKPGSPNKPKEPLKYSTQEINAFVKELSGNKHSEIERIIQDIFPVTDAESELFWDGEPLDEERAKLVVLSWLYQADIEYAAKQGASEEVKALLQAMNRDSVKNSEELLKKFEQRDNKNYTLNPYLDKIKGNPEHKVHPDIPI